MADAIEIVKSRNDFYRDNYRKVVTALLLSAFIIFILALALIYVVLNPPAPKYFATSTDGRIVNLIPLDQPNLSDAALLQWANTAAVSAYSYNFVNYRQALQDASAYFTPEGQDSFLSAIRSSNNLEAVISKKLVVSAVATGAPVILQKGILAGQFTWKVQIPLLVTFQSASQVSQQSVTVTLLIVRMSTLSSARGIGIAQFIVAGSGGVSG